VATRRRCEYEILSCIKGRRRANSTVALKKGVWLSKPMEIRSEVVSFTKHYEEVKWERPTLDGVDFKQLLESEVGGIEGVFWYDEVGEVIKQSDGNKSSSSD
jgi:hypothetical protein